MYSTAADGRYISIVHSLLPATQSGDCFIFDTGLNGCLVATRASEWEHQSGMPSPGMAAEKESRGNHTGGSFG
jgi:hypothetical protein